MYNFWIWALGEYSLGNNSDGIQFSVYWPGEASSWTKSEFCSGKNGKFHRRKNQGSSTQSQSVQNSSEVLRYHGRHFGLSRTPISIQRSDFVWFSGAWLMHLQHIRVCYLWSWDICRIHASHLYLLHCGATHFHRTHHHFESKKLVCTNQRMWQSDQYQWVRNGTTFFVESLLLILAIFINVQALKYATSNSIFYETVVFEQKLSEIVFFVVLKMSPVCVFTPFLVYSYFIYFTTDLGPTAFELPTPAWFPFNWSNPLVYLIAISIESVQILYITMMGACALSLATGSYLYFMAASKCIKGSLLSIGQCINEKTNQNIFDQFVEFMQFHAKVKQLSYQKDGGK